MWKVWLRAVRPFSFSASIIPVLVGGLLALSYPEPIHWALWVLAIVTGVLFHMGTNLISDYYDYKIGVDTQDSFGSSGVLLEGLLRPKAIYWGGVVAFLIAIPLGLYLSYARGPNILYLGILGLLGGYFYCAKPIGYKYFALGDLLVFLLMGPLMVIGGFWVATDAALTDREIFASLPIGFLVTAILHANNLRDIQHDQKAHVRTFASAIGLQSSKYFYYALVVGAFLVVLALVAVGKFAYPALLALISFPIAFKNMKEISRATLDNPQAIKLADVHTAQHHMLFGLLLAAGVVLTFFLIH